jgi:hypothetical protein
MALAQWSWRRMAALWGVGLALQLALVALPLLLLSAGAPRILRQASGARERWAVAEAADARWAAEQRATALAQGPRIRTSRGDTLYPVVRVPSGRPDPARSAALRARLRRPARVLAAVQFGLVPLALVTLTGAWAFARRRGRQPSATAPAS